jgi:hypothetical protein
LVDCSLAKRSTKSFSMSKNKLNLIAEIN